MWHFKRFFCSINHKKTSSYIRMSQKHKLQMTLLFNISFLGTCSSCVYIIAPLHIGYSCRQETTTPPNLQDGSMIVSYCFIVSNDVNQSIWYQLAVSACFVCWWSSYIHTDTFSVCMSHSLKQVLLDNWCHILWSFIRWCLQVYQEYILCLSCGGMSCLSNLLLLCGLDFTGPLKSVQVTCHHRNETEGFFVSVSVDFCFYEANLPTSTQLG